MFELRVVDDVQRFMSPWKIVL